MPSKATLEFSFSGLKTNVARWVEEHGRPGDDQTLRDVCATFQRRVVDTLVKKAVRAAQQEEVKTLVLGGGVAANRELRERAKAAADKAGLRLVVPPFRACTDNARGADAPRTRRGRHGHAQREPADVAGDGHAKGERAESLALAKCGSVRRSPHCCVPIRSVDSTSSWGARELRRCWRWRS
ncbi:MAG: hypothetical protein AMXMBFR56_82030 [Polyangiaceae bacterium]